jgi:hypothetical protein
VLLPSRVFCAVCRRINAFNYNKLLPRTTTGAALMQNGSLMARFAAPTCWNLLHMVHMDGVIDEQGGTTVFTQVRGVVRQCAVWCSSCSEAWDWDRQRITQLVRTIDAGRGGAGRLHRQKEDIQVLGCMCDVINMHLIWCTP